MQVKIPCTQCGRYAWLELHDWLARWPYVCRECRKKGDTHDLQMGD